MKIVVVNEFYDKFNTNVLFKEGEVLDFDDERAQNVIERGLAKEYKKAGRPAKAEVKEEVVEPKTAEAPAEEQKPAEEAPIEAPAEEKPEEEQTPAEEAEVKAEEDKAKAKAEAKAAAKGNKK